MKELVEQEGVKDITYHSLDLNSEQVELVSL